MSASSICFLRMFIFVGFIINYKNIGAVLRQQLYGGFFIFVRYTKQIWGVYYIMSWITREANLLKIDRNYSREPMDTINCFFIFVNKNDYIEKISNEHIDVIDGVISKERALKIIQDKRYSKINSKYIFKDARMFLFDLEPEQIQSYSQNEPVHDISIKFLRDLPPFDDIVVAPSIFIFHDINAIYFTYHEVDNDERVPVKPAIKIHNTPKTEATPITGRTTKRVRLVLNKTKRVRA